jgi:hypothetical protein
MTFSADLRQINVNLKVKKKFQQLREASFNALFAGLLTVLLRRVVRKL